MIVVVDYGMGNLHSVHKALESVGADVCVSNRPQDVDEAQGIVLPGVGSFAQGISALRTLNLIPALQKNVIERKKPFLGICLGMQLTAQRGEEHGPNDGLGWIDADVLALPIEEGYKIPHMGWDDMTLVGQSRLFKDKELNSETTFYFVHSYHFVPRDTSIVTGRCRLGTQSIVASASFENIHLVQFHPEKSQKDGLKLLANFLEITSAYKQTEKSHV